MVLALFFIASCATPTVQTKRYKKVDLYFLDANVRPAPGLAEPVTRRLFRQGSAPHKALHLLFRGPSAAERKRGLYMNFQPEALKFTSQRHTPENPLKNLRKYYLGMQVMGNTAIVDFKKEGLRYLNNTSALQMSIKKPIERTLKQFPFIEEVRYSVEGEVFRQWNA